MDDENTPQLEHPGICLKDSQGRVRVMLDLHHESGSPQLQFSDADGRPRLVLSLEPNGDPHISFFSKDSLCALSVGLSTELNGAGLTIRSFDGKHTFNVGVDEDGAVVQSF